MKSKKISIILLIGIIIFFFIMFFTFGVDNLKQESYSSTIIIGNSSVWKYQKRKWTNIRTQDSFANLSWKKYHVFSNQEEIGEYDLWYNDEKWYVFDKEKTAIPVSDDLFAYQANYPIKIKTFEKEEVEDYTYVNKVLTDHNLGTDRDFSSIYKVRFDIDSDGRIEDFYIISNVFALDFSPDTIFSFAFMVKNNIIIPIYSDTGEKNIYESCKPYYNTFLDLNEDGVYEIILSCGKYSALTQIDMLYQYENDEFKKIISNQ